MGESLIVTRTALIQSAGVFTSSLPSRQLLQAAVQHSRELSGTRAQFREMGTFGRLTPAIAEPHRLVRDLALLHKEVSSRRA